MVDWIRAVSYTHIQWLNESALLFLNEKLKGPYQTLKEMYGPVHRGIVTGLDEAFIVDETTKDRLIKDCLLYTSRCHSCHAQGNRCRR